MTGAAFTLFDTPLGRCGLAWRGDLVVASCLPEGDDRRAEAALRRSVPDLAAGTPPAPVAAVAEAIIRLLTDGCEDLRFVALDLAPLPAFDRRVYELSRDIAPGETRTYGELARALDDPMAARAVGRALGANPFPIIVPCHRVLAAGGGIGGFSAPGGIATKRRLLAIESANRPLPLFAAGKA